MLEVRPHTGLGPTAYLLRWSRPQQLRRDAGLMAECPTCGSEVSESVAETILFTSHCSVSLCFSFTWDTKPFRLCALGTSQLGWAGSKPSRITATSCIYLHRYCVCLHKSRCLHGGWSPDFPDLHPGFLTQPKVSCVHENTEETLNHL